MARHRSTSPPVAQRNIYLVLETVLVLCLTGVAANLIQGLDLPSWWRWTLYIPLLLFQGLWLYRCYIVGHEAAHRKLFAGRHFWNDAIGGIILLPLMVPLPIYRKIHDFHHGFNRRDAHTSALDTFVIRGKATWWKTAWYHTIWYIAVFGGGFFIHSLISVLLFLFVPPSLSSRISPAFKNWTWKDQIVSILLFVGGAGLHLAVYLIAGQQAYLFTLGFPMLSFAWILSLLLYIFHYDTTRGAITRYNTRSLHPVPILSWILMNFQEHATHHQYPNIPWYELPGRRSSLPEEYARRNQQTTTFLKAIVNQLKGPEIIYEQQD